jgi:hypothetical protein
MRRYDGGGKDLKAEVEAEAKDVRLVEAEDIVG